MSDEPKPGTGVCLVCDDDVPSVELVDHIRVMHPDEYGDGPLLWADGRRVVFDGDPDTADAPRVRSEDEVLLLIAQGRVSRDSGERHELDDVAAELNVTCSLENCPEHGEQTFPVFPDDEQAAGR
jgi:hypothetical protein